MPEASQLYTDGVITKQGLDDIQRNEKERPFSVHWELRTILYLGILLFTTGIGILVYKNIDMLGHQVVLAIIAAGCAGCFYYSAKHRLPYSNEASKHPSPFFDYIILLGCLLFGIFTGYLQYQYAVFGSHYGLATLFPTVVFFFCAYLFDHKGILSLGITGLAAWAGLSVTPLEMLDKNDFSDTYVIYTGIVLGIVIGIVALFSNMKNIKRHFDFSYNNFAANIFFISILSALFIEPFKLFSFLLLAGGCYYYIRYALRQQSFWFLLISALYGYIGLTYAVFNFLIDILSEAVVLFSSFYFIASCVGIILFFLNYKKILGKKNDRL